MSQNGNRPKINGTYSSYLSKSKVSERKARKPSFIPLRHGNAGYLELHKMYSSSVARSSRNSRALSACKSTASAEELQSSRLSLDDEPLVFRKTAVTDIKSVTPVPSELQVSRRKSSNSKRSLRSIHSSSLKVNECFEDHYYTDILLEGPSKSRAVIQNENHKLDDKEVTTSTSLLKSSPSDSSSPDNPPPCTILLDAFAKKLGEVACRTRGVFLCPICNEPLNNPAIISCGHIFCMRCVCSWFEGQENCPCCRYHISGKDSSDEDDTVLAKEFIEVSPVLASVFNAGNFNSTLQNETAFLSDDFMDYSLPTPNKRPLHSCDISAKIISRIFAPICKQIFVEIDQNENVKRAEKNKGHGNSNESYRCNALAAIWFLRQTLLLQASGSRPVESPPPTSAKVSGEVDDDDDYVSDESILSRIPFLIRMEAERGNDASRELLLRRVMLMKCSNIENNCTHFTIPCNSLASISSSRKLLMGRNNPPQRRFRTPDLQTLGKMLLAAGVFLFICTSVHFFDDHDVASRLANSKELIGIFISKLDLILYSTIIFLMVSYTEPERWAYLRRRAAERNRRRRRENNNARQRMNPTDDLTFS